MAPRHWLATFWEGDAHAFEVARLRWDVGHGHKDAMLTTARQSMSRGRQFLAGYHMGFLALGVVVATSAPLAAQQDGTQPGERLAAGLSSRS